jgi:hypothetical protein
MMRCTQCNSILKGYFEFYTCSDCYRQNVMKTQQALLKKEKSK